MLDIILSQLVFFGTLVWLLFVPGYWLVRFWVGVGARVAQIKSLEMFVLSFGVGVIALTFAMILADYLNIALTLLTILLLPLAITCTSLLISYLLSFLRSLSFSHFLSFPRRRESRISSNPAPNKDNLQPTKNYTEIPANTGRTWIPAFAGMTRDTDTKTPTPLKLPIFLTSVLIILTILIKGFYLVDTMFPTATDLGHHLFWSHKIAQSGELPTYAKQKLSVQISDTGAIQSAQISAPTPIADFIIGEHTALAAIEIVTGDNPFTITPILFLFVLDMMSVLAVLALALRLFGVLATSISPLIRQIAQIAPLLTLLLAGPLWAISGASAKFVSGGVIGNLFGNLLIPLALLALAIALTYKSARWFSLFIFVFVGLIYTHHLSTFILGYILAFGGLFLAVLAWRDIAQNWRDWLRMIFSPAIIVTVVGAALLLAYIWLPNYLNPSDIASATGAPEKSTRTGVGIGIMHTIGDARFGFGLIGIATALGLVHILRKTKQAKFAQNAWRISVAVLLAWSLAPLLMSTVPQFLGVNIISTRIANYTAIPFALIGGLGLAWALVALRQTFAHRPHIAAVGVLLMLSYPIFTGLYDNSQSLKSTPNVQSALQTIASAQFVNRHASDTDTVIKDHNYLVADTWMKLVFDRDYSYPLSRSYFKRYAKPGRETCTRDMISAPHSPDAVTCFNALNARYIIVNPANDSAQFTNSQKFDKIYTSNNVGVFYRK